MIIDYVNDGTRCDVQRLKEKGFLLEDADLSYVNHFNTDTGEEDKKEWVYDFVGFVSNSNDDILVSFPKHFKIGNIELDAKILFECFLKHRQKNPTLYIGEKKDEIFRSNYPFSAFFGVYDYYQSYGLYTEMQEYIRTNSCGRVSWKDSISRSEKFFDNTNKIMIFPLYYKKKFILSNFITECMIYVIDYTLDKFGLFLDLEKTGRDFPEMDYKSNGGYVLYMLTNLKQQTFKDVEIKLLDDLIDFFSCMNFGGSFYLKHNSFSAVWEDMVMLYLRDYYKGVRAKSIEIDKTTPRKLLFKKESFHPNKAKTKQFISPDYYYADGDTQLIFDAKYYNQFDRVDYKQIAYYFLLKELHHKGDSVPRFKQTVSALIAPAEKRESKIHFEMNEDFSFADKDFIILEEYFDIKDVMLHYLDKD